MDYYYYLLDPRV